MSFTPEDAKKIAHLARLKMSDQDLATLAPQITDMLNMVSQLNEVNTDGIAPMSHSLDLTQRLRPDSVTETNQREKYQAIAPAVEAGLYLVPKVIDEA